MTVETTDPVVAVVYGASCHASVAAGIAAAADLVAGQPGPWALGDDDRARQAAGLVARVAEGTVPGGLPATLSTARRQLAEVAAGGCPTYFLDQVLLLDDRIGAFLASYPTLDAIAAVIGSPPPPGLPDGPAARDLTVDLPGSADAAGFHRGQWLALIQARRLSVPAVLAALGAAAAAAGLDRPRRLADVEGNERLCRMLLDLIAEAER